MGFDLVPDDRDLALGIFAVLSAILIIMSYAGASVGEAYLTLLSIAVILQMVPNLYMFAALWKAIGSAARVESRRGYLRVNAAFGLTASALGLCLAFVPADRVQSLWIYEAKLVAVSCLVGGSALFFYLGSRRKAGTAAPTEE